MIRMGTAIFPNPTRGDCATWWHARCLAAVAHHQQICRIPVQMIAPLPRAMYELIGQLIDTHQLRLVVHAPIAHPQQLIATFERVAAFFTACVAHDSVIVCHVPTWHDTQRRTLIQLSAPVRRFLAIEYTHGDFSEFQQQVTQVELPIVFDLLHYHQQAPWPYQPIDAAMASIASWQSRPALLHLSSPSTAHSNRLTSGHGAHSDYLDVASGIWLLRSIKQAGMCADCELEVGAGPVALTQFQKAIIQQAPDLVPWIHGLTG
jgi:hypothetical protein